jgi:membrane associated rhomboid family serine protease
MAPSSRPYANRYIPSNRFPAGTKWLLIITSAVSILYLILNTIQAGQFMDHLILVPSEVVQTFAIWQVVTYLFLHGGPMHLLWNMLALWMFGAELERTWGMRRFVRFYFICGIAAGLTVVFASLIFGGQNDRTLGASGAIMGVLVGYAVMFPDRTLLFGFLIPMKSKYFVMIIAAVVLFQSFSSVAGRGPASVAVMAHLGGMLAGYFILRGKRLYTQGNLLASDAYKDWKMRRAKKKFAVYLRKNDSRRDRTLH